MRISGLRRGMTVCRWGMAPPLSRYGIIAEELPTSGPAGHRWSRRRVNIFGMTRIPDSIVLCSQYLTRACVLPSGLSWMAVTRDRTLLCMSSMPVLNILHQRSATKRSRHHIRMIRYFRRNMQNSSRLLPDVSITEMRWISSMHMDWENGEKHIR